MAIQMFDVFQVRAPAYIWVPDQAMHHGVEDKGVIRAWGKSDRPFCHTTAEMSRKVEPSPQIVYEDNHLLAISKPPGMLVHADVTGDPTLEDWGRHYLRTQYDKPGNIFLTPCHRLDRPVSGLCLFARTSKMLPRMQELFRERQVEKTYYAILEARPDPLDGVLEHYIDKAGPGQPVKVLAGKSRRYPDAKYARLEYALAGEVDHHYLVRVRPDTGRPHQIRAQLAAAGWPIRGDLKYGARIKADFNGIYLHSYSLKFVHPVKRISVRMTASPPEMALWPMVAGLMDNTEDLHVG